MLDLQHGRTEYTQGSGDSLGLVRGLAQSAVELIAFAQHL
jgi:hypothetical protein